MCMTLAVLLMSLMSWAIIPMKWSFSMGFIVYTPWRFNIMCIGCISLLAFLILGFLPESPKFLLSLGKEEVAIDILKRIHRINNRASRANIVSCMTYMHLGICVSKLFVFLIHNFYSIGLSCNRYSKGIRWN